MVACRHREGRRWGYLYMFEGTGAREDRPGQVLSRYIMSLQELEPELHSSFPGPVPSAAKPSVWRWAAPSAQLNIPR